MPWIGATMCLSVLHIDVAMLETLVVRRSTCKALCRSVWSACRGSGGCYHAVFLQESQHPTCLNVSKVCLHLCSHNHFCMCCSYCCCVELAYSLTVLGVVDTMLGTKTNGASLVGSYGTCTAFSPLTFTPTSSFKQSHHYLPCYPLLLEPFSPHLIDKRSHLCCSGHNIVTLDTFTRMSFTLV